jgi:hypothetical protein
MRDFPCPKTLKILRGFIGFTCYYRKIVKIYGKIASPLTSLLKNNTSVWSEVISHAFISLKDAMYTTLVLAMLDFNNSCLGK